MNSCLHNRFTSFSHRFPEFKNSSTFKSNKYGKHTKLSTDSFLFFSHVLFCEQNFIQSQELVRFYKFILSLSLSLLLSYLSYILFEPTHKKIVASKKVKKR